jgi:hypothetical protein
MEWRLKAYGQSMSRLTLEQWTVIDIEVTVCEKMLPHNKATAKDIPDMDP